MDTNLYSAVAKRVTSREVAASRLAPDYKALVAHFNLTHESKSGEVTDAARQIIIDGAPASAKITVDMLKGTDPGDVKHRDYWKAARAVRIGLVTALGSKDSEDKDPALRVTLSGEGGGSSVVPMDSDLGKAILAFLASEQG